MSNWICTVTACCSTLCVLTFAADSNNNKGRTEVIATIAGEPLTLAEFERKSALNLFQAKNTYYQAHKKALDGFIDDLLLEREARKEEITVEVLLERNVNSKLPKDPAEDVLRVYYEGLETNEPYDSVRSKILEHLRQRRLMRARTAYIQSLRSQAKVTVNLASPRTPIPVSGGPIRGRSDAPVLLVEYADYECPYCQQIYPGLKKLQAEYTDRLAFAYKDAPLPNHANAQKAAEATHCADAQGKYWEYHDLLFSDTQYDINFFKQAARKLNLNGEVFDKCLDSSEQAKKVMAQLGEAQRLGLPGTPSFFINGRFLSGAVTYESLRAAVEEELAVLATQAQTEK